MHFQCESLDVERALIKLKNLVSPQGSFLHPQARITELNQDLSVSCTPPTEKNEKLFFLPESCLPPIDKFNLAVEGNTLRIQDRANDLMPSHVSCFEYMVEIYYLCNKMQSYKEVSPWFALSGHPNLLQALIDGRNKGPKIQKRHSQWERGELDELLVEGFLGTRSFSLKSQIYEKNVSILHPFTDFLNHHSLCPGFQGSTTHENEACLWAINSQPVTGSQECLILYNWLDPFDALLNYGFVDESSIICRSVPIDLELSTGISLSVESRVVQPHAKNKLPAKMEDLRPYIPLILDSQKRHLTLSHLLIPGSKAPRALRRVLTAFIRRISPEMNRNELIASVREAEAEILLQNMRYYNALAQKCAVAKAIDPHNSFIQMIEQMIRREQLMIKAYDERLNLQVLSQETHDNHR